MRSCIYVLKLYSLFFRGLFLKCRYFLAIFDRSHHPEIHYDHALPEVHVQRNAIGYLIAHGLEEVERRAKCQKEVHQHHVGSYERRLSFDKYDVIDNYLYTREETEADHQILHDHWFRLKY